MRGGVSYIFKRYSKANNMYIKSYDSKQESRHVMYLNAKNLYGYTVPKFFLSCGFKWIHPTEFDSNKYSSNSSKV